LRHYRAGLWKGKGPTEWIFFREENQHVPINTRCTRRAVTPQPPPAPVPDLPQTRERVRRAAIVNRERSRNPFFGLAGRRRRATVHSVAGGDYQVLHRYVPPGLIHCCARATAINTVDKSSTNCIKYRRGRGSGVIPILSISCLFFLVAVWPFVLARWQGSAVLYVHELRGVSQVNRRTMPSGDRDLGVAGIQAQLARKIAAHVRTPGQHATAIAGLTLY
jgi:hypothetical protein